MSLRVLGLAQPLRAAAEQVRSHVHGWMIQTESRDGRQAATAPLAAAAVGSARGASYLSLLHQHSSSSQFRRISFCSADPDAQQHKADHLPASQPCAAPEGCGLAGGGGGGAVCSGVPGWRC